MGSIARIAVLVTVCALAAVPLAAQPTDFSGTWKLQTNAYLPEEKTPCVFEGTVQLTQVEPNQWSGPATLTLVSGPAGCPAEMMADCTGSAEGGTLTGSLDGGMTFGTAFFTATEVGTGMLKGTLGGAPAEVRSKATLAPKADYDGGFSTEGGPFSGTTGTFIAMRQSVLEIPTLTETGLLIMAVLLLATATYLLMRRRQQTL